SRDLGVMAAECLAVHRRPPGLRAWLSDAAVRYAVHGIAAEADLLSYVYFDRCYAGHLLALGYHHAAAHAAELIDLFSCALSACRRTWCPLRPHSASPAAAPRGAPRRAARRCRSASRSSRRLRGGSPSRAGRDRPTPPPPGSMRAPDHGAARCGTRCHPSR